MNANTVNEKEEEKNNGINTKHTCIQNLQHTHAVSFYFYLDFFLPHSNREYIVFYKSTTLLVAIAAAAFTNTTTTSTTKYLLSMFNLHLFLFFFFF